MAEHKQDRIIADTQEVPIRLKRVRGALVTPLWETDRWDGPLSGICRYKGQPFCFEAVNPTGRRRYQLYSLTDQEFGVLEGVRQDFRDLVGDHCEYNPDWTRVNSPVKPTWRAFYEKYPKGSKSLIYPAGEAAQLYFYIPPRKS